MVMAGTVSAAAAAGLIPLDFFVSFLVVTVSFFTSFLAFGFLTIPGFFLALSGLGAAASLASLKDPAPFLPEKWYSSYLFLYSRKLHLAFSFKIVLS